jgi:hypothetical protein
MGQPLYEFERSVLKKTLLLHPTKPCRMIKGSLSHLMPFTKLLLIFAVVTGSSMMLTLIVCPGRHTIYRFGRIQFVAGRRAVDPVPQIPPGGTEFFGIYYPILVGCLAAVRQTTTWLGFSRTNWILCWSLSVLLFFLCQPMVSHLAKLNAQLTLPDFLQPSGIVDAPIGRNCWQVHLSVPGHPQPMGYCRQCVHGGFAPSHW